MFIPVTRRVKGYTRFVGKYVKGRRKSFRPPKVYIFLIRINNRMNADISETIRATILVLGMQIPEIPAQRKFVSAGCHAHKPHKTMVPKVLTLE